MDVPVDKITESILAYIAGYLVAKSEADHTCSVCVAALCTGCATVTKDREALIGLKSCTGLGGVST